MDGGKIKCENKFSLLNGIYMADMLFMEILESANITDIQRKNVSRDTKQKANVKILCVSNDKACI